VTLLIPRKSLEETKNIAIKASIRHEQKDIVSENKRKKRNPYLVAFSGLKNGECRIFIVCWDDPIK